MESHISESLQALQQDLPVLFVNIGWAEHYQGEEDVQGGHGYGRRNVFAFSLSVAAHQVLQTIALVSGNERVGGRGPQTYHAYPGTMEVSEIHECESDCDVAPLLASARNPLGEPPQQAPADSSAA